MHPAARFCTCDVARDRAVIGGAGGAARLREATTRRPSRPTGVIGWDVEELSPRFYGSTDTMKWSLRLGTFAGIGVYLHWTFALLIGLLTLENVSEVVMVNAAMAQGGRHV